MIATGHCLAGDIARALKGRRIGRNWTALCPAHADRTPSLSIAQADDKVLVHCHAGYPQQVVVDALRGRGLWSDEPNCPSGSREPRRPPALVDDAEARTRIALRLWSESAPVSGSLAERYFVERRCLDVRPMDLRHALRWNSSIQAIVALMTDPVSGDSIGVHRTFLDADGAKLERKMLGRQGVVRLSRDDMVTTGLGLCEGLEDGLAVMLSGWTPIWVATSAGAIARFPVIAGIECLTIFADADEVGQGAAETCAERWLSQGRDARIATPGEAP